MSKMGLVLTSWNFPPGQEKQTKELADLPAVVSAAEGPSRGWSGLPGPEPPGTPVVLALPGSSRFRPISEGREGLG